MLPDVVIWRGPHWVDAEWLIPTLRTSYWGAHLTNAQIMSSIEAGPCFSAIMGEAQIGFVRLITDYAQISLLTDMIVDEKWRGQGIGSRLMESVVSDRLIKGTLCMLECRPRNVAFYGKFGFMPAGGNFMKRNPT